MASAFSSITGGSFMAGLGQAANAFSGFMSQSQAGEQAAQAAEYNAQVAQINAQNALNAAAADRAQQDRVNRGKEGKLTTQILKQGVELQGTPILLLGEEAMQGSLESQKITYKGQLQANTYLNQAAMYRYQADQARSAGDSKAFGTLLTGLQKSFNYFGG